MHVRYLLDLKHFNPRTRVECDFFNKVGFGGFGNFNPRTRVECDLKGLLTSDFVDISIHALV